MAESARAPTPLPQGRWVWWINLVLVAATALAVWAYAHRDLPEVFWTGDEAEYAELGRRIAQGRGFTSGIIYPSHVRWGVHDAHPSLVRAPLWPLAIAAIFTFTGPDEAPVHFASALCFAATASLAFALASALAGPWLGLGVGLAVATTPDVLLYAQIAATETPFAMWVAAVFLLVATRRDPFWIGLACGAAYLTRYNGGLLLLVATWPLFRRPFSLAPFVRCGLGFAIPVLPWWIRNFVATGEPFFSLYGTTLYFTPNALPPNSSLIYMLTPDFTSGAAMDPWTKFRKVLPGTIAHWPLATANAAALLGVLLGAVRRDRFCLSLLAVTGLTTILICFMLVRGRYLIPFVPVAIALGSVAWLRYGGRLRYPALACVLLAPLLPGIPALHDVILTRGYLDGIRAESRAGRTDWEGFAARMAPCTADEPIVIAQNAAAVAWENDTVTVYMTRTEDDFWTLVDAHPIRVARFAPEHTLQRDERFLEHFAPAAECGEGVYVRRDTSSG